MARRLIAGAPSVARYLRAAARISAVISALARSRAVRGTDRGCTSREGSTGRSVNLVTC